MANNRKNFFKNVLTTASTLAIIAGGINDAVAATHRAQANGFNLATGGSMTKGVFANGDTFKYDGNFTGVTGSINGLTIAEIRTLGTSPGNFTIVDDAGTGGIQVTISAVTTAGGGQLPIVLFDGSELILDGAAAYAGLGAINAQNPNNGTLTLTGNGLIYNGTIGAGGAIDLVKVNAGAGNQVTLGGAIIANNIKFLDDSILNLNGNLTGNIDFVNNAGTVVVANNITITGTVDSTGGPNGTLRFTGIGTVDGKIGNGNSLLAIDIGLAANNNANASATLKGAVINATTITLSANSIVGGGNHSSTLVLDSSVAAQVLTGAIDSTAVANAGTSVLKFVGANGTEVSGKIGNGNTLTAIDIGLAANNDANASATLKGAVINATTITLSANSIVGGGNHSSTLVLDSSVAAQVLTGAIDSTAVANGGTSVLSFAGNNTSEVTGAIGGTNALTSVQLNGNAPGSVVTFGGLLKAATLDIAGNQTKAQLNGGALINKLTITNANSSVNIANGQTLEFTGATAAIDLTGTNAGITFGGNNSVLKFNATGGAVVTATFDAAFNPGGVGKGKIILNAAGDNGLLPLVKSSLTITGGALGQVVGNKLLSISVTGDQLVTLNSAIGTALLEVSNGAKLLATSPTAGKSTLTTIGVGSDLEYKPTANMQVGDTTFANANSELKLTANGAARTFTLLNHIDPGGNGQGVVILNGDGQKATLTTAGALKTLGTGVNHIAEFRATGGTSEITALIDVTNVNLLTVGNGATLNSLTKTAFDVASTKIGNAIDGGGTLILDSEGEAAINLLDVGKALSFEHANSLLKLTNVTGVNHAVFKLKTNLAPGGAADEQGNLEINATNGKTITITKQVGQTIGTSNIVRLGSLLISGDQDVTIDTGVFAKKVEVTNTAAVNFDQVINLGGNSTLKFTAAGNTQSAAITATNIDFNNINRALTVKNGSNLNVETIANGANSSLTFAGSGNLALGGARTVTLGKISAGANAAIVVLTQGTYTTEVQVLHAGGAVRLGYGFNLTGGFNVTGGLAGTVKFLGSSAVSGALGTVGNALGAVTVAGAGTTLQVGGAVTVTSLDGTAGNAQNLKFINAGNVEVTGAVGGIQQFTAIEFNGAGSVDFKTALPTTNGKTLHFSANSSVITTGYDLGTTIITTAVAGGKLTVDAIQNITGNIANFGALHISGDRAVNLGGAVFGASITTKVGGEGVVNFNNAGLVVSSIGADALHKLKEVNFNVAGSVGDVYADDISILANGNATFTGVRVDANRIKFATAATSTANFRAVNLAARLVSDGGTGKGIANFAGTDINADVGAVGVRLAQANFAAGQVSAINANVYADAIAVDGKLTLTKDATFDGATTINNAAILALGAHDLTLTGGAVALNGNSTISTTINGVDLGNLVAGAGSNITLNGNLSVEVDALAAVPVNGQKVTLIQKNGGTLNLALAKITVTKNGGAFAKWRDEIAADGSLILTNEAQIAEVIRDAAVSQGLEDVITEEVAQAFEDFEPGTQGNDIVNVFNKFLLSDGSVDKPAIADGQARLANTTANEVVGATFEDVATMTDHINARMFDVASFTPVFVPTPDISSVGQTQGASFTPAATLPTGGGGSAASPAAGPSTGSGGSGSTNTDAAKAKNTKVSANELSGIAAGDESDRYGIWATPFYSKSTQKKRGSSSGYKSDGYGGTFGFDTRASEEMIVGLAVTAMNTDIKHKDFKSGDKTKVGTTLFSAYSNYQFGNNWFGQGVFSVGSSKVKNKEQRRISTTAYSIASSEYSSMTFASEIIGGYNHLVNNQLVLTPMFGLGYSRINDSSYQETGSGPQLLSVTKRASHKLDLVGGLRVTGLPFIVGEVSLTPEIHGAIRHDVIGKGSKVDAKIPGLPKLPSEKAKLQKTYYNLGASLKVSYGMMDYGVAADTMFAKKYLGVNGSVNVRVNF